MTALKTLLWIAAVGVPMLTVLSLAVAGWGGTRAGVRYRRRVVRWSFLATVPAGILAVAGPAAGVVDAPWLMLGTRLEVDGLGRPLLLMTVLLYGGALLAVHFGNSRQPHLLTGFLLASFLGNAGVFVAADTPTFYLSFALMSIAAFGAVVHTRTDVARRAGRVYLALTMVSELTVLCALIMIVDAGGLLIADAPAAVAASENRTAIVALLLVGFGIKAGTVPLHVWLPLAHPAAPPPASAVLSGAMVKAGIFGWIRFLPLGDVALPGWGITLTVLALIGAFAALPLGILHKDPKVPLAYSTISQMGFLAVLIGIALASPEVAEVCILAAVVYSVHHGIAKGGLFLGVTVWQKHGRGRAKWLVVTVLAVLALAVAGAPLGSGSIAKYAAKEAVSPVTFAGITLTDLLPWVGTVSTLLLARTGYVLLTGRRGPVRRVDASVISWALLAPLGIVLTWVVAQYWAPTVSVPDLDLVTLWDATWPILIGVGIAGLAVVLSRREILPPRLAHPDGTVVPAGDLVVPEERVAVSALRAFRRAGGRRYDGWVEPTLYRLRPRRSAAAVDRTEETLAGWSPSGAVIIGVTLILALVVVLT